MDCSNAANKLNALQAGELDKVLEGTQYAPEAFKDYGHAAYFKRGEKSFNDCLPNAAKVEVTKVVLDEVIGHLESVRHDLWEIGGSEIEGSPLWETRQTLTLLQQLKESL
jgi:hypothetical protein